MIESERLTFVLTQQKKLRAEIYSGLEEAVLRGEIDSSRHGKLVILPSSFVGGARGLKSDDRPDIVSRMFKVKLDGFIRDVKTKKYLELLKQGATCYEDLRFVNGVQHDTFRDACFALGLLDDDKEYIDGIVEASFWSSAHSLRLLFVSLLSSESVSRSDVVRKKYLVLSDDEIQNFVLADIEKLLMNVGKGLRDYHGMPYPESQYFETFQNTLISDELSYDREALGREHLEFHSKFTNEQLHVHDTIMSSVNSTEGKIFFVYGYGVSPVWTNRLVGKLVFGGDFRQILPVVPKGSRKNVVNATINSSYLWRSCTVLRLTRNMRLLSVESSVEASKLKEFSSWVASIGDGVVGGPNDGDVAIDLPSDIVLSNVGDPLKTIVENIYPSCMDSEELSNCLYDRAILGPTLDVVDEVNQFMISMDKSQGRVYLSSDSISNSDSTSNGSAEIHSVEFLNNLKCSGDYVLEARVLGGHNLGDKSHKS
ncbi:uncharacterized protein LOC121757711 [Salvia splendens]|uniref:uncharacterized protein LOC121757711 n=1 Tax=Salvia splendens TaxID=180675 RepID=UPI001C263F28|nr:uncharacterized protein LOC121757711 [Salvia splendens]